MNVDDFLFACSADHPRGGLMRSAPVQGVRLQGPLSLAVASSLQRAVFGVDMTEASKRGDDFYCLSVPVLGRSLAIAQTTLARGAHGISTGWTMHATAGHSCRPLHFTHALAL
jgi:hypothetical protein